jgi:tetratricopeptide (TPR) repeat protein
VLADEAAAALRRSAVHTLDRSDQDGSRRFLERAVDFAQGEQLALALVELGELVEQLGDYRTAIEIHDRFFAVPESASMPGPRIRAQAFALVSRGMIDPEVGMEKAERDARALLAEAEELGDAVAIRVTVLLNSLMAFFQGRCAGSRAIASRLLPEAGSMNPLHRGLIVQSLMQDGYFGAVPVSAGLAFVEQIRDILWDGLLGTIRADTLLLNLISMSDDADGYVMVRDRIDRAWTELGDPMNRLLQSQGIAESARILGRTQEAEGWLRELKGNLDERGESGNNSTITAILATYLAEDGRFDESAVLVEQARAMTAPDDLGATVPVGWADALLASASGDHERAIAVIDEALATVRTTDYLNFTADTIRTRGWVLSAAGRTEEAAASLDEAAALWTHKENVASLRRMQAWRDEHGV